jgi:predicted ribosome quality control (RQC) complex YloA/Tae2 family protein
MYIKVVEKSAIAFYMHPCSYCLMKTELTSVDLHFLLKELQTLVDARIDKVYEQDDPKQESKSGQKSQGAKSEDKKDFLFVFHKSSHGKMMLRIRLPGIVYLTESKPEFPETPPGFCMFLRKHLDGARVKEVRQHGFDRILEIVLDAKEGKRMLVCELFSKGNMLLLDEGLKIKGLLESQNWEARTIRGGTLYQYPPSQPNTPRLGIAEFEKIITASAFDSIVKTFAIELGLGGLYAEELCRRAGIPKEKKRLSPDELHKAYSELNKMLNADITANISDGEILPIETGSVGERYPSFNQALDTLSGKLQSTREGRKAKEKKSKEEKTRIVIEMQEKRLAELEKEITESQKKGELIYEHYIEIKELLDGINADRKKMGWEELKKKYAGHRLVKDVDEKKGIVTIDLAGTE